VGDLYALALEWTPKTGQQFQLAPNQKGHISRREAERMTYTVSFKANVACMPHQGLAGHDCIELCSILVHEWGLIELEQAAHRC